MPPGMSACTYAGLPLGVGDSATGAGAFFAGSTFGFDAGA
jgi:hypothetical protein